MLDVKILLASFGLVFLAELGDKTQLTALAFTASSRSPWSVFLGTALALTATSALAVAFGSVLARYFPERAMHIASGAMFVLIGLVLLVNVARKAPAEPAAATARPPSDRAAATPARGPVFGLIVRQALRFEEDIARFFTDLAADLPEGSSASPALLRLAEEERAHSQSLTKVAELASDGAASAALNEALATVALGSPELTLPSWTGNEDRPQGEPTAGQMTPSEASALRAALKAEEGAAAFYLALSRQSPLPVVQDAFRWLAMEEIRHSQHLTALLRATVEGSGSA